MAIAKKQLGALEDLVFSAEAPLTFQQTRSGVLLNLTKICAATLPYAGSYGAPSFISVKEKIDAAIALGSGDMLKSIYDTNNNGKVDNAEIAEGVNLDITNTTPPSIGQLRWNQDEKTADLGINGVVLQLGQELMTMVRNTTATIITQGTACMGTGTIGASGRITVAPADMTNIVNAFRILGVATEDIAPGTDGFVTYFGKVRTVDTSAWDEGDVLYLSNTVPGALTNIEPTIGVKQTIARVVNKHAINGTLMVRTLPINELAYQPLDATLTALAGVTTAADKMIYSTGADAFTTTTLTAAGRALLDDVDVAAQRTTLGISAINTPSTAVGNVSATNVQAAIAELDSEKVAKVTSTDNAIARFDGTTGAIQNSSVVINDSGNVGIGTSSPQKPLDVRGGTPSSTLGQASEAIRINTAGSSAGVGLGCEIQFHNSNDNSSTYTQAVIRSTFDSFDATNKVGGSLIFATKKSTDSTITERMRIDSSGNVGIGTSSPTAKMEISNSNYSFLKLKRTTAGGGVYLDMENGDGDLSKIELDANGIFSLKHTPFGGSSYAQLTVTQAGNVGLGVTPSAWNLYKAFEVGRGAITGISSETIIVHNAFWNGSNWIYKANDFATLLLIKNGKYEFLTAPTGTAGNAITFTTAITIPNTGGIQLPNTAIANATTLDWYEEGTFTPVVTFSGGTSNNTYSTQVGTYTRIGDIVYYSAKVTLTAKDAGGSGYVTITGLPFSTSKYNSGSFAERFGITPSGAYLDGMTIYVSGTAIRLLRLSTTSYDNIQYSEITGTMSLTVSGTYKV